MSEVWLDPLSDFLASGILPSDDARVHAGLVIADTLAAMAAGTRDADFVRLAGSSSGGPISVPGTDLKVDRLRAALLNGIAGTVVEIDEGHYAAGGHPAIHCIAAALPEAESSGASGRAFVDAVVFAYEAATRIGAATRLRRAVHAHGTWGTVGAAVAVARLRGFSARRMREAMCVAASLTLVTSRTSGLVGATVRHVYAGLGAHNGLLACDLVEAGIVGQADAMEIAFGDVVGEAFDPAAMLDGLGSRWAIESNFFKLHASCRETHGAVETWNDLAAALPAALDPDRIGSIEVATFDDAARLDERNPANSLAARYSLPFALATRIVRGSAFIEDFSQDAVDDARIRDIARRVEVVAREPMSARFPGERLTHLTVRLKDGTSVSAQRDGCDGDPSRPVGVERLRSKFLEATRPVWGEAAAGLFELWRSIDREASVRAACARSRTRPDLA